MPAARLGGWPALPHEFWLGFHEDLRHTQRVRALADHIAAEMRR